jgi:aminoglycoside/choline kinase family phosphotransferase
MWRLATAGQASVIGVYGPDEAENRAFVGMARDLRGAGLPVPEVLAEDLAAGVYLVTDLGDQTLFQRLLHERAVTGAAWPPSMAAAYEQVIQALVRLQIAGGEAVDFSAAHPVGTFDRQAMAWDLAYFKYCFLMLVGVTFHEGRLERDFQALLDLLGESAPRHFLFRDFQSRNVMWWRDAPWFIDFQGGRRGPLAYDLASLLYDAKAAIPESARETLLTRYLEALAGREAVDPAVFRGRFVGFVLLRILQALGAYGLRGLHERKLAFVRSIPHALGNVVSLFDAGRIPRALPELERVLRACHAMPTLGATAAPTPPAGARLVLRVASFSYRQGVPPDEGGHGGGHVFDCRALPNPGRDPVLARHTGQDDLVVAALAGEPTVESFYERAWGLVDAHVRRWLERDFDALSVQFGCTGGQHRSVYLAERLARHVSEIHPEVAVVLTHHERRHWPAAASV